MKGLRKALLIGMILGVTVLGTILAGLLYDMV